MSEDKCSGSLEHLTAKIAELEQLVKQHGDRISALEAWTPPAIPSTAADKLTAKLDKLIEEIADSL